MLMMNYNGGIMALNSLPWEEFSTYFTRAALSTGGLQKAVSCQ
jgi:hypothetical protein